MASRALQKENLRPFSFTALIAVMILAAMLFHALPIPHHHVTEALGVDSFTAALHGENRKWFAMVLLSLAITATSEIETTTEPTTGKILYKERSDEIHLFVLTELFSEGILHPKLYS